MPSKSCPRTRSRGITASLPERAGIVYTRFREPLTRRRPPTIPEEGGPITLGRNFDSRFTCVHRPRHIELTQAISGGSTAIVRGTDRIRKVSRLGSRFDNIDDELRRCFCLTRHTSVSDSLTKRKAPSPRGPPRRPRFPQPRAG